MELSSRFYHINLQEQYQGILKYSIVRHFDSFIVTLNLHRITVNDPNLIQIIADECYNNPTRLKLLDRIENQLTDSVSLNYKEIEFYLTNLSKTISYFKNNSVDFEKPFNYNICDKLKIPLTTNQAIRLYYDFESFYKNYLIIESIFRLVINQDQIKIPDQEKPQKIYDQVNIYQNQEELEQISEKENIPVIQQEQLYSEQEAIVQNIFNFCCNALIKTSLIHQTFVYFQYVNNINLSIENETLTITVPHVTGANYIFDKDYFKSLILVNTNYTTEDLKFYTNKIYKSYFDDNIQSNPVYLMMITYLFYIYSLRFIYETHTNIFEEKFIEICSSTNFQERIINHFIKSFFDPNKLVIKISDDEAEFNDEKNNIEKFSQEYSYLINVSQEEFANKILGKLEESDNRFDLKFDKKRILDIEQIIQNKNYDKYKKMFLEESNLVDPNNTLDTFNGEKHFSLSMFDYSNYSEENSNRRIISYLYKLLIDYVENPNQFEVVGRKDVDKNILKYFDIFKSILNSNYFKNDNIDTLSYYKILCENLPESKLIPHTTILYLLYQIIIPYYYDQHGVSKFNDQLI